MHTSSSMLYKRRNSRRIHQITIYMQLRCLQSWQDTPASDMSHTLCQYMPYFPTESNPFQNSGEFALWLMSKQFHCNWVSAYPSYACPRQVRLFEQIAPGSVFQSSLPLEYVADCFMHAHITPMLAVPSTKSPWDTALSQESSTVKVNRWHLETMRMLGPTHGKHVIYSPTPKITTCEVQCITHNSKVGECFVHQLLDNV